MPAAQAQTNYASTTGFGTYYKLFAADSPWNARPINPFLGSPAVKRPRYNPTWAPSVDDGKLSLGVFMAKNGDPSVTVYGKAGKSGVGDPDTGTYRNITLPRWPANVVPAAGGDGHADIVDTVTGILHSFYQLRYTDGKWTAGMYSWTRVDGRGWGDASHWSQGVRSSGAPPSAGLIRLHEVNDGDVMYHHALAMSLPEHTLANGITAPAYVYPATTTDTGAKTNTGVIPLGTRLMLPPWFDVTKLSSEPLRKIASTLKTYGAFAVDRNYDTAYGMYVENGPDNFNLMPNGWSTKVVADLEMIRAGLRPVLWAQSWVDGNGKKWAPPDMPGVLSMRGNWLAAPNTTLPAGKAGTFDTWAQAIVFPYTTTKLSQINYTNGVSIIGWSKLAAGEKVKFVAETTGNATVRLQLKSGSTVMFDSGYLGNGKSVAFKWPTLSTGVSVILLAESGVNTASKASGMLMSQ